MSFQDFVRKGGGTARVQAGERVYSDLQRRSSSSLPLAACIASSEDAGPSTSLEARRTRIAGIIFGISTKVNRYKRQIDMIGGPADNVSHRQAMKRASDKILEAADKASRGIRDLDGEGETVRLVQAKLVSDLRGALQDFREAQMQCAKWEKTYVPKPDPMPEDRHTAVQGESQAGGKAEEQTQELQQKWLRNAQLDSEIAHRDALLEERDRGIREIQQQIGEVNEIFRDLAVLVHDQGQQLYDVEAAVTDAADGAKQAEGQLIRASRHHRKTCTTLLLLLAVVAGALAVLYLILA